MPISITKLKILECYHFIWLYALAFFNFFLAKAVDSDKDDGHVTWEIEMKPENIDGRRMSADEMQMFWLILLLFLHIFLERIGNKIPWIWGEIELNYNISHLTFHLYMSRDRERNVNFINISLKLLRSNWPMDSQHSSHTNIFLSCRFLPFF